MTLSAHRRTRLHESGHAVIAFVLHLGGPTEVFGSGADGGHTRGVGAASAYIARMSPRERHGYLEAECIYSLAGQAALEEFGDPDPSNGAGPDREYARQTLAAIGDPSASLDVYYDHARQLARTHRRAIERFADAMAAHDDHLAGPDVKAALEAAFSATPGPKRRPVTRAEFLAKLRAS